MERSKTEPRWLLSAVLIALVALAAVLGIPSTMIAMAILPAAASVVAVSEWIGAAALCGAAGIAGIVVFPQAAWPVTIIWCVGIALAVCLKTKKRLTRPIMITGVCLAAWTAGLITLLSVTGGQIIGGLAQAACDWVDQSPQSSELLIRAYSAGYARLKGTDAWLLGMGGLNVSSGIREQLLMSLRVSLEEALPGFLCSAVVYHTGITVLLSVVLPDSARRRRGEKGVFPPMEQWYIPRKLGWAVFVLCLGPVIAFLSEGGAVAYMGRLCGDVFRFAFLLQGICWLQWMGKKMGIRSGARNLWSVILSVVAPLIPILMGMIDQRKDARHLRPEKEVEQE